MSFIYRGEGKLVLEKKRGLIPAKIVRACYWQNQERNLLFWVRPNEDQIHWHVRVYLGLMITTDSYDMTIRQVMNHATSLRFTIREDDMVKIQRLLLRV